MSFNNIIMLCLVDNYDFNEVRLYSAFFIGKLLLCYAVLRNKR